jgi:toxin-antitoxin system PIN domain toxin
VVAVDTNVLIYAEITSSSRHAVARDCLRTLAEGPTPWAIAWPCVYEFLRLVTHPRVYHPPVPLETAREDLRSILASPSLVLLAETARHAEVLDMVLAESRATGNLVHDAHIVALCREHGVREIVTGDSDFRRFRGMIVTDPFTPPASRRR